MLWVSQRHVMLFLVFSVYFASNSVIASDTHAEQSAVDMNHSEMKHGNMDRDEMQHDEVDVSTWPQKPSLTLTANKDVMAGWNLQIEPNNFEFAPQRVNQANAVGEGHAHLYINGEKITRLYSNWYYLNNLQPGVHSVMVVLNANNHGTLILQGRKVSATIELVQD